MPVSVYCNLLFVVFPCFLTLTELGNSFLKGESVSTAVFPFLTLQHSAQLSPCGIWGISGGDILKAALINHQL
jgi:hypothetical protein